MSVSQPVISIDVYKRQVLEIVEKDFSYESVFRFLRTGLSGFAEADIDFLENYVLARGIRGASRWKKKFLKPMRHTGRIRVEEDVLQQELARADQLRERFWKQIEPVSYTHLTMAHSP